MTALVLLVCLQSGLLRTNGQTFFVLLTLGESLLELPICTRVALNLWQSSWCWDYRYTPTWQTMACSNWYLLNSSFVVCFCLRQNCVLLVLGLLPLLPKRWYYKHVIYHLNFLIPGHSTYTSIVFQMVCFFVS